MMQAAVKTVAKAGVIASIKHTFKIIKGIKTVSLAITYVDPDDKKELKTKEFIVDVDKVRETSHIIANRMKKFANKKGDKNMAQWKVIWLNEMGEEQNTYCNSEDDRNTKMQELADSGYSPVYREV